MKVRVLQWNVWVNEDPEEVANEIKRFDVDVVLTQELFENTHSDPPIDTAAIIAQKIGYYFIWSPGQTWDDREDKTAEGVAIFSRWKIKDHRQVELLPDDHNGRDSSKYGRIYLEAKIPVHGKMMTVGTTHLSFIPKFAETEVRKIETNKLMVELNTLRKLSLFGADLNSIPESKTVEVISNQLKSCGPALQLPTFPTKPFDKHGEMVSQPTWRLDYLFATPDVKVISAEIPKTEISDHLPIRVEIEV